MQYFKGHLKEENKNYYITFRLRVEGKLKWPQWSIGLPVKGNKNNALYLLNLAEQHMREPKDLVDYQKVREEIQEVLYDAILSLDLTNRVNKRFLNKINEYQKKKKRLEYIPTAKEMKRSFYTFATKEDEMNTKSERAYMLPNMVFTDEDCSVNDENNQKPSYCIYCGIGHDDYILTPDSLFSEFLEIWIDHVLVDQIRRTTWCRARSCLKHRDIDYFASKKLKVSEIDSYVLQEYYTRLKKGYTIDGNNYQPLKAKTVYQHQYYIKKALQFAVEHSIIQTNPADHIRFKGKRETVAKTTYTMNELLDLFQLVEGKTCEYPVLMAAYYGMRRSEIMGLQWSDINFEKKYIRVQHTLHYVGEKGDHHLLFSDVAKSNRSTRSLPLLKPIEKMLLRIKEETRENRFLFRDKYTLKYSNYVFVNQYGMIRSPETVSKNFRNLVVRSGLRYVSLHNLRHTVGTLLCEENVNLENIKDWLGHADIMTTSRFYIHANYKNKVDTANVLENMYPDFHSYKTKEDECIDCEKTDSIRRNENIKCEQMDGSLSFNESNQTSKMDHINIQHPIESL